MGRFAGPGGRVAGVPAAQQHVYFVPWVVALAATDAGGCGADFDGKIASIGARQ